MSSPVPGALADLRGLCDHLHISKTTAYRLIRDEDLPTVMVGGSRRFRLAEVDAWIDARNGRLPGNVDPATVGQLVDRTRRESGVPPEITDPDALRRAGALVSRDGSADAA